MWSGFDWRRPPSIFAIYTVQDIGMVRSEVHEIG